MALDVKSPPARPAAPPRRAAPKLSRLRRDGLLLLLGVPGLLVILLFHYVPMLGNVIAFKDYQPFLGIWEAPWVGFENFRVIFNGDPAFLNALVNTLVISLVQIVFVFPVPIALALLLNSLAGPRVKRLAQSILYLPHFMSWVVVVAIFQHMLGNAGLLNTFLRGHDLATLPLLGNPDLFLALITSQVIWKDAGWGTIIFLAALSRVDPELYEASAMDGASKTRQLWHVTLPGIRGVIVLMLILKLGDVLTVGFEQIILQQGMVGTEVSEVLDTYVYTYGVVGGNWGVAAAVGLVKGLVGLVLVLGANKVAHLLGERGLYTK
ncbi:putative transport system integral membrane protein [[Actinomadura] parvosata subsp. kistnae]|uniref:Polysaccharide ABC transporter ATP-binding protein n=1 Tax=[Actinomadura] parvosata subsp. kistnae TaxID=1909395 RepID=A0A1U9ZWK7_9ACTN|nr:ABC transporter permease subunit [Nonomuraea sp. ATCC 55076]AQZ62338.1 polysaccharide ABC transporter ATP-binding protein [Nonomuraea sp. ATCC 55076]SPL99653.1 putative transport system integral membrane protein [Actinomadura parvosata subsp. kistnae]